MKTHKCKEHGELTGCLWSWLVASLWSTASIAAAYAMDYGHPWALGVLVWIVVLIAWSNIMVRYVRWSYRKYGKGCPKCLQKYEANEMPAVPA